MQSITFTDIYLLTAYLGSFTLLVGTLLFLLLMRKLRFSWWASIVSSIIKLILSPILALVAWHLFRGSDELMLGILFYPALISEFVSLGVAFPILRWIAHNRGFGKS